MQNDRDVSLQVNWVPGMIRLGDQGSQNIRAVTHRFRTSRHPTFDWLFSLILHNNNMRLCMVVHLERFTSCLMWLWKVAVCVVASHGARNVSLLWLCTVVVYVASPEPVSLSE